jgi:hypothetical protein
VLAGHHGQTQNSRFDFQTRRSGLTGGGRFDGHVFGATTLKRKSDVKLTVSLNARELF